ncbi:MFS transporter [Streptomyces sp. NPDC102451]|uniref:MFS transporter n=1 Tax=Streptomyces sp. NPDC102451 TaxID=3366177 RepID=UPI0038206281
MGSLLNPLNTTMISTALVAIGHSFGIGAADTAWLISVLYLASAVAQPVLGKLADTLGPRRVFLAGLVVVIASGVVGALAPGFGTLIVSRLLLGVGTSAAYPAAMAVLRDESRRLGACNESSRGVAAPGTAASGVVVGPRRSASPPSSALDSTAPDTAPSSTGQLTTGPSRPTPRPVLARLSFAALGSAAVGPALGGLLVSVVGWRGIFAVNVPVALLALGAALLWVPADPPRDRAADGSAPKLSLDPLGIGLFTTALTVLVFFLLDLAHPQWWLLAPFAVLTAVLVRWQLRTPQPFIDIRMLAGNGPLLRTYIRHGLSYLLIYCVMYGYTQWLEEARGFSSGHTGLLMLPMSVTALVCSLLGARTKGLRGPLTVACLLLTAGAGILLFLSGDTPLAVLLLAGACFGAPQGLIGTSNQAAVQAYAPPEAIGAAAGLQRTAQYIGAITASSLIALAYADAATDAGLHLMAAASVVLAVLLAALTLTDRALRART